jgi:DNA-binding transcriptional ArsR family regulator
MTHPATTDPEVLKAYGHLLRVRVLDLLEGRVASPARLAIELEESLGTVAYHVRQLADVGLVELVGSEERRGALEHRYTAKLPRVTDAEWAGLSKMTKRAIIESALQKIVMQSVASAAAGGFDRDDIHITRSPLRLDREGWTTLSRELSDMLERVERVAADSASRLAQNPNHEIDAPVVVMMLFERPGFPSGAPDPASSTGRP